MLECFDAEGDDSRHIRCGAAGDDAQRNDWTEPMRSPCFAVFLTSCQYILMNDVLLLAIANGTADASHIVT